MWLLKNNGNPVANQKWVLSVTIKPMIKPDYSAAVGTISFLFLWACGFTLYWWFVLKFFKDLNDNGMVGDSISAEVPTRYWQYPASWTTNHSGVTSDMLYFRCFVVQSSNSTLYNINTVVTAYKLIWPYLIKMESWFYPSHCPIPSRLTCSESLQPWWLQSTETF